MIKEDRNVSKHSPYEDAVNAKIANQKMVTKLDNITDKLVNQYVVRKQENLEVCDDLGISL